jgi:TolB-like protein
MSPEQVRAEAVDGRSDLFSFGIILYELLTGTNPFRRPGSLGTMGAILHEQPDPLPSRIPGVNQSLQETLSQLLEKDLTKRFQSTEELQNRLKSLAFEAETPGLAAFLRSRSGRRSALVVTILVVLGLVGRWLVPGSEPPSGGPMISSIAVLPFTNLSGDSTQAYFVDGVTDELSTTLSKIGSIIVYSPSVTRRFAGTDQVMADIAQELSVDAVMDGSVLREGGQVRVTARLIDAGTGQNLWAESYQRALTSIMALQGEVARAIADRIQLTLTPEEEARLTQTQEVDPEAYDAYLLGMFHWNRLTPEGLDLAESYFELALEKDTLFALAYAGLASVWGGRVQMRIVQPHVGQPRALELAYKALELDDGLAEVHHSLAGKLTWAEWRWEDAWYHWRRALEINPNDPRLNAYYAHFLCIMGLPEEGLAHAQRALEVNPFDALYHALGAMTLVLNGRYDEAIETAGRALEINPDVPIAGSAEQAAYIGAGMLEEQLAHQRERISEDPERVEAFERGLAEGGYNGAQFAIAELLAARYERDGFGEFGARGIAARYLDGWDIARGMYWFKKAVEERDQNVPYLLRPPYTRLRAHPDYRALLEEDLGFPLEVVERYMARPVPMAAGGE